MKDRFNQPITKVKVYTDFLKLVVNYPFPENLIENYLSGSDEGFSNLQGYISSNMNGGIYEWATSLGIIEAADHMFECALENGNITED